MKDARFTIPTPALLSRVVDMLDHIQMDSRDTTGDLYEYMLSKIAPFHPGERCWAGEACYLVAPRPAPPMRAPKSSQGSD